MFGHRPSIYREQSQVSGMQPLITALVCSFKIDERYLVILSLGENVIVVTGINLNLKVNKIGFSETNAKLRHSFLYDFSGYRQYYTVMTKNDRLDCTFTLYFT